MFVRLLVWFVIAITTLVVVMAFKTFNYTSTQIAVDAIEPLEIGTAAAAKRLARAISFRTISTQNPEDFEPEPFVGLNTYLEQVFPRTHAELKRETVGDYSLLYSWVGADEGLDPILLLAHTDVVPVAPGTEEQWIRGAHEEIIESGFVWGRGALDDKVNVMAILESVELLLRDGFQPRRTILLAFGHDEEIGGRQGAATIARLLEERGVKAEFVLDEGGAIVEGAFPGLDAPVGSIGIAEKGYVSFELRVEAVGGHSSQPPAETAVGTMARAVQRLENRQMPASIIDSLNASFARIGPEMPLAQRFALSNLWLFEPIVLKMFEKERLTNAFIRTTTAATMFNAGVKDNVLPAEATAVINFRILPGDTVEKVAQHIDRVVDDDRVQLQKLGWVGNPSMVSPIDSSGFQAIETAAKQIYPGVLTAPYLVVGGTDARHYEAISDNIYRFSPVHLTAEDVQRIHGVNERIGIENYGNIIRFFRQLILNTAS